MSELGRALQEIRLIRQHVAQSTEFRGYGPATLITTSGFALLAALVQQRWLQEPADHMGAYTALWVTTAVVSLSAIGLETVRRSERLHSGLADEMLRMAVEQFIPSLGAGALLTLVLEHAAPSASWMLPGLWQVIFSLGVFASCRFLPRGMLAAGVWYLLTGLFCLSLGDTRALSPWAMGGPFAVGQLWAAGVLLMRNRRVSTDEA